MPQGHHLARLTPRGPEPCPSWMYGPPPVCKWICASWSSTVCC